MFDVVGFLPRAPLPPRRSTEGPKNAAPKDQPSVVKLPPFSAYYYNRGIDQQEGRGGIRTGICPYRVANRERSGRVRPINWKKC